MTRVESRYSLRHRSAVVETQFAVLLRPEIDPEDPVLLGNSERFSKKDSSNQLGNVPENDLHA